MSSSSDQSAHPPSKPATGWKWHHKDFAQVLGAEPAFQLVLSSPDTPFAHEAGVYVAADDALFVTSNRLIRDGPGSSEKTQSVQISRIDLSPVRRQDSGLATRADIPCGPIHMANGGVNYRDGILFCAQGSGAAPSGLFYMSRRAPFGAEPVVTSYRGVPFNSVNDVVVRTRDGSIWFTDPAYGHEQGYKAAPSLPSQVYRYVPGESGGSGSITAVADGFGHPNGLCFSPDERTLYVTDTDKVHGAGHVRPDRPSSIYAFDVRVRHGQPIVCNRRLFAFVETGIPDGIKCDTDGRVYSGCGDGIHVWSEGGVPLGRIQIAGGVANFCFGRRGEIWALNEHHVWRVAIASSIRGALLADLSTQAKSRKRFMSVVRKAVRSMFC
ncbi:SMP-30 Gluconolaconase LRE-like region [Cordyceps militaris]|uniref:SMP-30 Gluconolaconase LRE-like region n=1 Tax=Cordyceps militaris TaxID=73501 RepID=A0A2H4S606_CORMI|nr:SMP-30 Gluconolaconase LRE-like region [Cordyceps militaris]